MIANRALSVHKVNPQIKQSTYQRQQQCIDGAPYKASRTEELHLSVVIDRASQQPRVNQLDHKNGLCVGLEFAVPKEPLVNKQDMVESLYSSVISRSI